MAARIDSSLAGTNDDAFHDISPVGYNAMSGGTAS
jgi:hypothetical protein